MCHSIPAVRALQQAIPNNCTAKTLGPGQRLTLAMQALAGAQTISRLADEADVSRKFVYQQAAIAQTALDEAFTSAANDEQVLFYLPVTKSWLRQVVVALILICHSSYRGIIEFFRDLLDVKISVGTVHNIVQDAIAKARPHNDAQDLSNVRIPALDELFQSRRPVLVGADTDSTYCFLLSVEDHRDAETWAIRLLEAKDRGLAPTATIADFGTGLRAGQKEAFPDLFCRGDVFHALYEVTPVAAFLENRAYELIAAHDKLAHKKAKAKKQGQRTQELGRKACAAARAADQAIALADDVACLLRWLQYDVLAVSGLPYDHRCQMYDFIVAELKAREPSCPHRLRPACTMLKNQRDHLLAFAAQLECDLTALATEFQVSLDTVRELLDVQKLDKRRPQRWQREADLQQKLGDRFYCLNEAVKEIAAQVVRASSVIENLNSRLRSYFFLRRHVGPDYLVMLQFYLNHRRFLRSEHAERVGKSPAELLTGKPHPHWLEMLGFQRFSRN